MTGRAIGNRLAIAQARAKAARARLSGTIVELQARTRPTSLVHDLTDTLKERGADVVAGLVDTAKSKPARTGALMALVGLFFARGQIARLVRRAITSSPPASPPGKGPIQ